MTAQQMNVDNIANNLANASTVGFKARRAQFQDLLYQNFVQPGAAAGAQTVVPQRASDRSRYENGIERNQFLRREISLRHKHPLDMVIQGRGFFQVRRADGSLAYTRAASFNSIKDGQVVTSNGDTLEPAITIPAQAQAVTVATRHGTVSFTQPRTDGIAAGRPDSVGELRESGGTEQPWPELVHSDRRIGRSDRGIAGRTGRAAARCCKGYVERLERQRGARICQLDRSASEPMRRELQGCEGRGPKCISKSNSMTQ